LFVQSIYRHGLRVGIGHFHKRGYASSDSGPALRINITLVRKSGITKMHLIIQYPGNKVQAPCIDNFTALLKDNFGDFVLKYFRNPVSFYKYRTRKGTAFVNKDCLMDKFHNCLGLMLPDIFLQRKFITPKKASPKM